MDYSKLTEAELIIELNDRDADVSALKTEIIELGSAPIVASNITIRDITSKINSAPEAELEDMAKVVRTSRYGINVYSAMMHGKRIFEVGQ